MHVVQLRVSPTRFRFNHRYRGDLLRMSRRRLRVLTLLDTLEERGKAARDAAGWHVCLDALEAALGGQTSSRERVSTWGEVHPHYVETFGPPAATIGPPGAGSTRLPARTRKRCRAAASTWMSR